MATSSVSGYADPSAIRLDDALTTVRHAVSDVRHQVRERSRWHADQAAKAVEAAHRADKQRRDAAERDQRDAAVRARIVRAQNASSQMNLALERDGYEDPDGRQFWRLTTTDRRCRWLPPTIWPGHAATHSVARGGSVVYFVHIDTLAGVEAWLSEAALYIETQE